MFSLEKSLQRQIRILGTITQVEEKEADTYTLIADHMKVELEHGLQINLKL